MPFAPFTASGVYNSGGTREANPVLQDSAVPLLPMIDLLILLAWTSLAAGGLLKFANLVFSKFWTLLGLAPFDFFMIAGVLLVFALTLVGRSWVKLNDPGIRSEQRAEATRAAYSELTGKPTEPEPGGDAESWKASSLDTHRS